MTQPNNILQQVQTYQMSELAILQNKYFFINKSNKRFNNFQNFAGNLGSTVTFDLPPRFVTTNSLVAQFQGADQRVQNLTVDQEVSVSYSFTSQQYIFNVEDYMERFGKSAVAAIGAKIETNVALNCVTAPYRFYGNAVDQINSPMQLAQALANFRDYGTPMEKAMAVIPVTSVPNIVNSGLSQFATYRNNDWAMSWELGPYSDCDWYESNLLPTHFAGTAGNSAQQLTVTGVTTDTSNPASPTYGAVTAITFSGATASDVNAVKKDDSFQFMDGVSLKPNLRYLTWTGYAVSNQKVQFRATADAAADGGGNVTVNIYPPLQVNPTNAQNLNTAIQTGMKCTVLPDHRAGLIMSNEPLFLAMPQLPDQSPYYTGNAVDPDTGASFRHYYGSVFGQNQMGTIRDCIWGSTFAPEYGLKLVFPV